MKRTVSFIIIIALLLSGCGGGIASNRPALDPQLISADALLTQLLDCVPERNEPPEAVPADEHILYLAIYGIDPALVKACAIARLGGARVFELAVIDLTTASSAAERALLAYLKQRQGEFTGYAPDQAAIAEQSKLFAVEGGFRLVLAITEDTGAVRDALISIGYTAVSEVDTPRQQDIADSEQPTTTDGPIPETMPTESPASEPKPSFVLPQGWQVYTDPRTDNMSAYKTSFILSAWESGTPETLPKKDREIYDRCAEIIAQCVTEDMTDYEKELSIYRWLTRNVAYDWRHQDPSRHTPRDSYGPYGALVNGEAVCLGFATAFQLLMDMLDIECITVVGAAFNSSESHAWNMVKLNGEWYCVDATWDMGRSMRFDYFNVTSDYMAKTDHQWNYENTPMATATDNGQQ